MTGAISWFVRNPVAANLMMTVMVVGGFFTLIQLTQEEFPAIDPEAVQIVARADCSPVKSKGMKRPKARTPPQGPHEP